MDLKIQIKQKLTEELLQIERSLVDARRAQREAPTPIESHSDTTMSEKEKLVTALEIERMTLKDLITKVGVEKYKYMEIDNGGVRMKIVLVPDGIGGRKIGEVLLVSVNTPLAKALLNGDVAFGGRSIKILLCENG